MEIKKEERRKEAVIETYVLSLLAHPTSLPSSPPRLPIFLQTVFENLPISRKEECEKRKSFHPFPLSLREVSFRIYPLYLSADFPLFSYISLLLLPSVP